MCRVLKNKKKVRVLSIGTGEKPFTPIKDSDSFDLLSVFSKKDEFLMNMDVYTAHHWMKNFMWPGTYLRLQTISKMGMDKIDPASIAGLKVDGVRMYKENKEELEKMIKIIVDERFKPKAKK